MSGGGGGGGGASEKNAQAQFEYDNKKFAYDYQEMQDEDAFLQRNFDIKIQNQQDQIAFQNQTRAQEYQHKLNIANFDFNNQNAAYAASVKSYEQQLDYNNMAAEIAVNDNTRKYNEQLMDLAFQNEDLLMKLDETVEQVQMGREHVTKDVQLEKAGASLTQSQLVDRAGLDRKGINQGYARLVDKLGIQKQGVRQQYQQTLGRAGLKSKGIALALFDAHKDANMQQRAAVLSMKGKRSDIARKMKEARLQGLMQAGQQRNLGQTGRTARRNLGNVLARQGDAQAALTDLLTREESSYNLDLQKVSNALTSASMRADLSFDEVATEVLHAQQDRDLSEKDLAQQLGHSAIDHRLQLEQVDTGVRHGEQTKDLSWTRSDQGLKKQMDQFRFQEGTARKRTKFSQQQIQETMKSAAAQFEAENQQISLQKFQQDLAAQDRLAPKPVRPPVPPIPSTIPTPQHQRPPEPPSWERYSELKPIKGAVAKGPSGFQRALGFASGMLSIAAPFMGGSDDRFKYNLNRVGTSPSGVPKYTFKYRLDGPHGPTWTGTSAQDLLAMGRDDAVFQKEKGGFYYVDYSKLDVEFEQVTAT